MVNLEFVVFQEVQTDTEWGQWLQMAFNILLVCAENTNNLEYCALVTARLHLLVQTRLERRGRVSYIYQRQENYAFLVPIMKALLVKGKINLN